MDLENYRNSTIEVITYTFDANAIKKLAETGLRHLAFLDGRPGTGQAVTYQFDIPHDAQLVVKIETRRVD